MLTFVLACLGGVLTIGSPCILPIVPFVFTRADRPFLRGGLPLLAEAGRTTVPAGAVVVDARGAEAPSDETNVLSPETYVGYDRAERFVSPDGGIVCRFHARDRHLVLAAPAGRRVARAYVSQLGQARVFGAAIVTKIERDRPFFRAEDYHQDFLVNNPRSPYIVINGLPKIEHLKTMFPDVHLTTPVLADRR